MKTTTNEKPRTITRPPQGWQDFKIKALPGKIAGFAQETEGQETEAGILIPDEVVARAMHLEIPPYQLTPVFVVSSGVQGIPEGFIAWAKPLEGQWWRHGELDGIPEGWQIRLYGVHADIHDQILGISEDVGDVTVAPTNGHDALLGQITLGTGSPHDPGVNSLSHPNAHPSLKALIYNAPKHD